MDYSIGHITPVPTSGVAEVKDNVREAFAGAVGTIDRIVFDMAQLLALP